MHHLYRTELRRRQSQEMPQSPAPVHRRRRDRDSFRDNTRPAFRKSAAFHIQQRSAGHRDRIHEARDGILSLYIQYALRESVRLSARFRKVAGASYPYDHRRLRREDILDLRDIPVAQDFPGYHDGIPCQPVRDRTADIHIRHGIQTVAQTGSFIVNRTALLHPADIPVSHDPALQYNILIHK